MDEAAGNRVSTVIFKGKESSGRPPGWVNFTGAVEPKLFGRPVSRRFEEAYLVRIQD